ncbi:MAG TPA: TRAP transporter small permease [Steroidobacteraceae bacterium]|nr:TRAP transporter small permease [Steroidobacteraceae bacterium]
MSTESAAKSSFTVRIANVALVLAGISLIGMAVVEGWQVFARYVLNNSPSWTEPVALLMMSTTMMLGAAVGVRRESHFGFFIALESSPPPLRKVLYFVVRGITAGIGLLMAIVGARLAADGWTFPMAGVPLPQGVTFVPISIGGALIVIFAIERMFVPRADRE